MSKNEDIGKFTDGQQHIAITTPYGTLHLEDASAAHDHIGMKADWLEAFLVVVSGDGHQSFNNMNARLQHSLIWEAQLAATEIVQILKQVKIVARTGVSK
jgi:hypothetical protein